MANKAKSKLTDEQKLHAATVDAVAAYMAAKHPNWSIDLLLARPTDALRMAITVAVKTKRISRDDGKAIESILRNNLEVFERHLDQLDKVCGIALAARKKGLLKKDRY